MVDFDKTLNELNDNAQSIIPPKIFEYFLKIAFPKNPTFAPNKHKQKTVLAIMIMHLNLDFVFKLNESPQKKESILTASEVNSKVKIFISNKAP